MQRKISYLKWQSQIKDITPENHCIGNDIILIDEENTNRAGRLLNCDTFRLDVNMAIVYEKGWVDCKINMKQYHIEAPAVLVVFHNQICQPISYSENLKSRVIVMSKNFSDSLFEHTIVNKPLQTYINNKPLLLSNVENIFTMFYDMLLNIAKSPLSEFRLEAAKHLTLAMFYGYSFQNHNYKGTKTNNNRKQELYNSFLEYVELYHKENREVSFYAKKLCMTSKYLSQILKEVSGRSALEIIDEYAITTIKALLSSTSLNIQQISDEMNFPSQSVFGKYFKRLTGISPKEYRNTIK